MRFISDRFRAPVSVQSSPTPAHPTAFGPCLGWLHPADGRVGVLLVSAWGFDEFCARRSWRRLGERLAHDGYPTLRFDLPDTGSSLAVSSHADGWRAWLAAVDDAVDHLKSSAAVDRVVLIGMGLGGALAETAARERTDVVGLGLLAPVVTGRSYLREIAIWSRVLESRNSKPFEADGQAPQVAGFELSASLRQAVGELDLLKVETAPARQVWLAGQPGRAVDVKLAERLTALGAQVTSTTFVGHDRLVGNPLFPVTPEATFDALLGWVRNVAPSEPLSRTAPSASSARLTTRTRVEEGVRIGSNGGLFGVFTRPSQQTVRQTVLFLSTSRDPQIGRGRMVVQWSRALADAGVASLRLDCADVGDSPPRPGGPKEVIFNPSQIADAVDGLDWLEANGRRHFTLVGRCSGAHLAFQSALADERVRQVVLINPSRLIMDPRETIDQLLRPPIETYAKKVFKLKSLKRLFGGKVSLHQAANRLISHVRSLVSARSPSSDAMIEHDLAERLHAQLRVLADREVAITLVCGDHDIDSHEQIDRFFGKDRSQLAAYPNISIEIIKQADHNLSTATSQLQVLQLLKRVTASNDVPVNQRRDLGLASTTRARGRAIAGSQSRAARYVGPERRRSVRNEGEANF